MTKSELVDAQDGMPVGSSVGWPRERTLGTAPGKGNSGMRNTSAGANETVTRRVVNFGCGPYPTPGCINFDGSPTILLAKLPLPASVFGRRAEFVRTIRNHRVQYGLARNLNFRPNSLDGFYTSHTLEHLPPRECKLLLQRILTWLKPSGILRVVLPDLRKLARDYVSGQIDAEEFVARTHLAKGDLPPWAFVVSHARHQHMYDFESFHALLRSVGFRNATACQFRQSQLQNVENLDLECRRDESFYLEAVK